MKTTSDINPIRIPEVRFKIGGDVGVLGQADIPPRISRGPIKDRSLNIKQILVLGLCCLFIVPMTLAPFVTASFYQKNLENRAIRSSQQNLSQIANQMQYMITSMVATANLLCYDQEIIEVLSKPVPDQTLARFQSYQAVQNKISTISSASLIPYNAEIFVLGENGENYSISGNHALEGAVRSIRQQKDDELNQLGSYILWIAPVVVEGQGMLQNSIAVGKTIKHGTTNQLLGVVVIHLYLDKNLRKLFTTNISQTTEELLLLNEKNELIYSTSNVPTAFGLTETNQMDKSSGSFIAKLHSQKEMVDYQVLSRTGWKLVQLSSYDGMMADISRLRNTALAINLVLIALLLFAGLVFSEWLAAPLHELCLLMGRLPTGDFTVRMPQRKGRNEITQLSQGFNKMVSRTEELFHQLERSYQAREDLRLEALRAQVNPHFLFNTLNSIKWMAVIHGDDQVSRMIASLAHLLEYSLSPNNEMVSVEKEIECLQDYAAIQKMRFGDRFRLDIDIPSDILHFHVPLFLFQPIVENSILHAFDEDEREGVIRIEARREAGNIVFCICDNGCGMDPGIVNASVDCEDRRKGKFSKIGIRNVDERIKIVYGKSYGLRVESAPMKGTSVYLTLPPLEEVSDGVETSDRG